ncbi:hypothetical protein Q428_05070 [Fervidicella metallireducens AeB]|uniref:Uncharacterized protein n=1 Tax=Fervidicella metallireducens AeB TaxID=1403537 RepID=A0A017RWV6_9CLOT|nr:hypothetical protein [Fervidicella metallireducens]EYE89031.1 hypothetical protein Q428_05070 [Fervidicella metallireducens AeB]
MSLSNRIISIIIFIVMIAVITMPNLALAKIDVNTRENFNSDIVFPMSYSEEVPAVDHYLQVRNKKTGAWEDLGYYSTEYRSIQFVNYYEYYTTGPTYSSTWQSDLSGYDLERYKNYTYHYVLH